MKALLSRWQSESGDGYVASLARLLVGVMLLFSAVRSARELVSAGYFGDVFHLPVVPEPLVPGRGLYALLVVAEIVLAAAVVIGVRVRPALLGSAAIGLYLMLCDRLQYHNNRYALLLLALLLSFAPCDRAFVLRGARLRAEDRRGDLWAQRLIQLQMSIIYLASGGSKLLDPDWRSGRVLADRFVRSTPIAVGMGVPAELMARLAHAEVSSFLAKLAIATELFLAFGLWLQRTRGFAFFWGAWFHITIELTARVELFGWLSLSTYALFARPALEERVVRYDPGRRPHRAIVAVVRRLDWLRRFRFEGDGGGALRAIDRDGRAASGLLAAALIARATPLLVPAWLPLFLLAKLTRAAASGPPPADARPAV